MKNNLSNELPKDVVKTVAFSKQEIKRETEKGINLEHISIIVRKNTANDQRLYTCAYVRGHMQEQLCVLYMSVCLNMWLCMCESVCVCGDKIQIIKAHHPYHLKITPPLSLMTFYPFKSSLSPSLSFSPPHSSLSSSFFLSFSKRSSASKWFTLLCCF